MSAHTDNEQSEAAVDVPRLVRPIGGEDLTVEEAEIALRKAMDIIQSVGTTGVYDKTRARNEWMKQYFPLYDI